MIPEPDHRKILTLLWQDEDVDLECYDEQIQKLDSMGLVELDEGSVILNSEGVNAATHLEGESTGIKEIFY